jgi:tetraacyldisaccharide 4'-kinase
VGVREPSWWYADAPDAWIARALAPFGALYGTLSARRMQRPPEHRSTLPVICVGNFTAGGTGKTPFVRTVLSILRDAGHMPVVLSRGYGGTVVGPHWVNRARDSAVDVGDEPLLLAADARVLVSRNRVAGAKLIEAGTPGTAATVIVMDDGLQNPALAKDLSFAVVDAARGHGNGRCIPAGPLRAPLAVQVPFVQAVILNTGTGAPASAAARDGLLAGRDVPVLRAGLRPTGPLGWLKERPIVAYAGIGVPERFFQTLRAAGAVLEHTIIFADHHNFSEADAQRLLVRVAGGDLQLVTTEKDAARLKGHGGALAKLAQLSRPLPVAFALTAADRDVLARLLARHAPPRASSPPHVS